MSALANLRENIRELDRHLGLRPPYPPVALQFEPGEVALVRLKPRRRGRPQLEALATRTLPEGAVPSSIFHPTPIPIDALAPVLAQLFEASGTRPGRVSIVIPDNLAKISVLTLPERPASRKQLDELVRAQMRRAVPFRIEDTRISYQVLPAEPRSRGMSLLVVLVRSSMVEQYERALELVGARVGLVDICTPNLLNLCRRQIGEASGSGGDVALLNCDRNYFSMVIVRSERLIFFRCKTYSIENEAQPGPNGMLARELSGSFSYYQEKLAGKAIQCTLVRSVGTPFEEIRGRLVDLGYDRIERICPAERFEPGDGAAPEASTVERLAPALGAALARR